LRKEKRFLKKPLAILFCMGALVLTSIVIPTSSMARDDGQDRISERDLRSFERYLDEHWETAQELYRDPELINDRKYVRKHPALRDWLENHPEAAREIRDNPRAVLWRERGRGSRDRRDEDVSTGLTDRQRRNWEEFLDDHRAVARDLSRNPDLVNDTRYVHDHGPLDEWLRDHREAAAIIMANPSAYIPQSSRSSEPDPEDGQPTARDIQSFEQYLDRNWEVADALYREPDLIKSRGFLRDNPSLDDWMRAHPTAARAIRERPQDYLWRERSMGIDGFLRGLLTPR
jgi:hypothetical protein